MSKTQLKRRAKKRHNKTRRLRGKRGGKNEIGGNSESMFAHKMDDTLEPDDAEEAKSYQQIINHFIETQKDSFQYQMLQEKFSEYEEKLKIKKGFTYGDLAEMKNLVFVIIKDDVDQSGLYFDKNVASFQNLLNNILMYFVNDIQVDDVVTLNYRKRIINNKPYIEVIHKKKGEETIYDVNELLATLKNELRTKNKTELKSNIIATKRIRNTRTVEKVPKEESEKDPTKATEKESA